MHLCCTSCEVCTQCCAVAAAVHGGRAGTYKCVHVHKYMQVHGQAILAAAAMSTSGGSGGGCKREGEVMRYGVGKGFARSLG